MVNEATFEDLLSVPGIGKRSAKQILELRNAVGTIREDDLCELSLFRKVWLEYVTCNSPDRTPRSQSKVEHTSFQLNSLEGKESCEVVNHPSLELGKKCDHDESLDMLRMESGSLRVQSEVVEDNILPVHNQEDLKSQTPDQRHVEVKD